IPANCAVNNVSLNDGSGADVRVERGVRTRIEPDDPFRVRCRGMEVAERIRAEGASLTGAERRVAEVILHSPQSVGFGTVAELARSAGVGAATVVRLSAKLGYDGFTELQDCVQRDLMRQLRPAAERIREAGADARSDHVAIEVGNVTATLAAVDPATLEQLVER